MKVYRHYPHLTYMTYCRTTSYQNHLPWVLVKNSKAAKNSVKYPILGTVLNYIFYHSLYLQAKA